MMGAPQMEEGELNNKLEQTKSVIEEASRQFKNPVSERREGEKRKRKKKIRKWKKKRKEKKEREEKRGW